MLTIKLICFSFIFQFFLIISQEIYSDDDIPCKWTTTSGIPYDLRPLTKLSNSYVIIDGDIPCTPETEPSYAYSWNFCSDVTSDMVDKACILKKKSGVALQSIYISDEEYDCYIIGKYNPLIDDLYYSLLDIKDPSKGISMKYPSGESCVVADDTSVLLNVTRSATIDIICDNSNNVIVEAQESSTCQYHLVMKSYYGCPTTCGITSNGLCDSHGYCKYDSKKSQAYCYCNEGHYGHDCSKTKSSHLLKMSELSYKIDLLTTLFKISLFLIAVVGVMILKLIQLKGKEKNIIESNDYEMVETSRLLPRNYNT